MIRKSGDGYKITAKGHDYLENLDKPKIEELIKLDFDFSVKENFSTIEEETLTKHLEGLIYDLKCKTLEGQKELYEELEILKAYILTLDKKSWFQLFQAKMVDVGLGSVISEQNGKYLAETVTEEGTKLLS